MQKVTQQGNEQDNGGKNRQIDGKRLNAVQAKPVVLPSPYPKTVGQQERYRRRQQIIDHATDAHEPRTAGKHFGPQS